MLRTMVGLGGVVLVLGGCASLAGTWKLAPGQPPADVTVAVMTLAGDGTFTAEAMYGPREEVISGFYTFADGQLELTMNGTVRTYEAVKDGDELTISHKGVSVRMIRVRKPKP